MLTFSWNTIRPQQDKSLSNGTMPRSLQKHVPRTEDIILGRGTVHTKHQGNANLYRVADSFLDQYSATDSKVEKTAIIHIIYQTLSDAGHRFLKLDDSNTFCVEIDEKTARMKIGHTMRYRQAKLNKLSRGSSYRKDRKTKRSTRMNRAQPSVVTPPDSPKSNREEPQVEELFSDETLESVLGPILATDLSQGPPSFPFEDWIEEEESVFFLQPKSIEFFPEEFFFPVGDR